MSLFWHYNLTNVSKEASVWLSMSNNSDERLTEILIYKCVFPVQHLPRRYANCTWSVFEHGDYVRIVC